MYRWAVALLVLASLLSGCFVPVPVEPRHYHHHDWR
jgi:hypothetical protein